MGRALLFAASLAFYTCTLAPSLTWGDGARLQLDVALGASNYWLLPELRSVPLDDWPFARVGVATWDHPLYQMVGRGVLSMPVGEPLFRLNLFSAVTAAATLALAFAVGTALGYGCRAAALGAVAIGVSHTFWFHAVTTEVLALHALFMVSLLWLAVRWAQHRRLRDLHVFALLAGAGLANHLMLGLTLLPTVVFLAVSARRTAPRAPITAGPVLAAAGLFLLGFAPWWVQFLRVARALGLGLTVQAATWFPAAPDAALGHSWAAAGGNLVEYALYLVYQFTPLGVALGVCGFLRLRRAHAPVAALLLAVFVIHLAFSVNYPVSDRFAFHLPSYVTFGLCIGGGAADVLRADGPFFWRRREPFPLRLAGLLVAVALGPPILYAATPGFLRAWGVTGADIGVPAVAADARDGVTYFLNPNKRGDRSAERFARSTMARLAPRAVVMAPKPDLEAAIVLRYVQAIEGLRPDVSVESFVLMAEDRIPEALLDAVRASAPCRPVYLASLIGATYGLDALRRQFTVAPEANLFRLSPRPERPAAPCTVPGGAPRAVHPGEIIRSALR